MLTFQKIQRLKTFCRGFSLVELLVVCALIAILGTAIYAAFYQGVNLWKRSQVEQGDLKDIFFAERFSQDLRSAFAYSDKKISGKPHEFSFYTLLSGFDLGLRDGGTDVLYPCRIRYFFEPSKRQVFREVQSYSQVLTESKKYLKRAPIFDGPLAFQWRFMGSNSKGTVLWQKTWEKDYLPNAVKWSLEYEGQKQLFTRTFNVPGGGRREQTPHSV